MKEAVTYLRPFLMSDTATTSEMHKALFAYLLPIFKRNVEVIDSDELKSDLRTFSDDEIYEKYIINAEESPYKLNIETDFQEYLKRPCS